MSTLLQLVNTPEIPKAFKLSEITKIDRLTETSEVSEIKCCLKGLSEHPTTILGSKNTPSLHWFLAKNMFPDASLVCFTGSDSKNLSAWMDLNTGDLLGGEEPKEAQLLNKEVTPEAETAKPSLKSEQLIETTTTPAQSKPTSEKQKETKPVRAAESTSSGIAAHSDSRLVHEIFKFCSWGLNSQEQKRNVESLVYEGLNRPQRDKRYVKSLEQAKIDGKRSYELAQTLEKMLKENATSQEINKWIKQTISSLGLGEGGFRSNRILRHLELSLKKKQDRQEYLKKRTFAKKSTLNVVKLDSSGYHPNAIRNLSPVSQWDVLIDETGDVFELDQAEALGSNNNKLGKVVALVLARGYESELPPQKKFHAADASDKQIDELLDELFKANKKVGIIGFSMKDASRNGWLSQIEKLIYTVLMQLPLLDGSVRVSFNIEQRSGFTPHVNLLALEELLLTRLKAQFPGRFENLSISLKFIPKEGHPYNAYVDSIAHMWGSRAQSSKDRLKKSALLGHCLFRQSDEQGIEKLTWLLEDKRTDTPILPSEWYQLCEGAEFDKESKSLLSYYLNELSNHIADDAKTWQSYLDYVLQKIADKDYGLTGLCYAINWLQSCQPEGRAFTPMLELHYSAARLAVANHQGKVIQGFVASAVELSEKYIDQLLKEDAPAVGNLILKVAVMTTNAYEFNLMIGLLERCLAYPIEVFGLKTYYKLQSQLAQLYAFKGDREKANDLFTRAISGLEILSDKKLASREMSQTNTYTLINAMGAPQVQDIKELKEHILKHMVAVKQSFSNVSKVAISGDLPVEKYTQHLLLRAMVYNPDQWQTEIVNYLSKHESWQQDSSHPWPLILAYRGWLWSMNGNTKQSATCFNKAQKLCRPEESVGPTIEWIGLVIGGLMNQVLPDKSVKLDQAHLDRLLQQVPSFPKNALLSAYEGKTLNREQLLEWLQECLPFNFH